MSTSRRRTLQLNVGKSEATGAQSKSILREECENNSTNQKINHAKSTFPKGVRYEFEQALLGLCDVWFEDIKPHLIKNNIKLHAHRLGGKGDYGDGSSSSECLHTDPGSDPDRQRLRSAGCAGPCTRHRAASRERSHRQHVPRSQLLRTRSSRVDTIPAFKKPRPPTAPPLRSRRPSEKEVWKTNEPFNDPLYMYYNEEPYTVNTKVPSKTKKESVRREKNTSSVKRNREMSKKPLNPTSLIKLVQSSHKVSKLSLSPKGPSCMVCQTMHQLELTTNKREPRKKQKKRKKRKKTSLPSHSTSLVKQTLSPFLSNDPFQEPKKRKTKKKKKRRKTCNNPKPTSSPSITNTYVLLKHSSNKKYNTPVSSKVSKTKAPLHSYGNIPVSPICKIDKELQRSQNLRSYFSPTSASSAYSSLNMKSPNNNYRTYIPFSGITANVSKRVDIEPRKMSPKLLNIQESYYLPSKSSAITDKSKRKIQNGKTKSHTSSVALKYKPTTSFQYTAGPSCTTYASNNINFCNSNTPAVTKRPKSPLALLQTISAKRNAKYENTCQRACCTSPNMSLRPKSPAKYNSKLEETTIAMKSKCSEKISQKTIPAKTKNYFCSPVSTAPHYNNFASNTRVEQSTKERAPLNVKKKIITLYQNDKYTKPMF